jgi:hypothetical protein
MVAHMLTKLGPKFNLPAVFFPKNLPLGLEILFVLSECHVHFLAKKEKMIVLKIYIYI